MGKKKAGRKIKVTGPGLNSYFAEHIVDKHGPERALGKTSGPMREAVIAAIEKRK